MRMMAIVVGVCSFWPAPIGAQIDQLTALQQLLGEWEVRQDSLTLGVLSALPVANGKGVNTIFRLGGGYEAFAIWSVDPQTKQVHAFEVNSEGMLFDHVGEFVEVNVLLLENRGVERGPEVLQVSQLTWESPDLLLFSAAFPRSGEKETYRMIRLRTAHTGPGGE